MVFVPFPEGTFQLTWSGLLRGQVWQNTNYFYDPGVVKTASALTDICNTAMASWGDVAEGMHGLVGGQCSLQKVLARNLDVEAGTEASSTVAAINGDAVAAAIENSLALVVTLRTGIAGRSFRGRNYIAGLASSQVDSSDPNRLTGAAAAQVAARWSDVLLEIGTFAEADVVVASRIADGLPRTLGVVTPVVSYSANTRLDNQRRRMPSS